MKLTKRLPFSQAAHWPEMVKSALREAYAHKKDLIITIKADEETRSSKQNRLLWGVFHAELAKHIEETRGETYAAEDIHDYVVNRLLPKRVVTVLGEPEVKRTETKKLKVKEFAEFLTRYEVWALESLGCQFSHPDDLYIQALMRDGE